MSSETRFIVYARVSTDKQGRSGLGLEAQFETVSKYAADHGGLIVGQYVEVESGKRNDRPQLAAALAACRSERAVLLIAKLDRLARNARFLLTVVEGAGDAGVIFCDMPSVPPGPVGKFMLTQLAAVAELEAGLISQRTKAALAAAKERGTRLGNPSLRRGNHETARAATLARQTRADTTAHDVLTYIEAAKRAGAISLRDIAGSLEARGIRTPSGSTAWSATQVSRVLARA
ncbi:recombinase family protein [Brevundimonas aurifodinae]|uniref:Recombinase family protein n=1 Tax=Brevundimonas aurifodinae TaxID=1508312 RepID=A0ABV1NSH1_9CAUL|nr:MAG: hypothetical protein B7Z42_11670 [Brevundimonas sp. 12-68-7]